MKIKSMEEYFIYLDEEGKKVGKKTKPTKDSDRYFSIGRGIAQMASKSVDQMQTK